MNARQADFGWINPDPNPAHEYLLPGVLSSLNELYGERQVQILDLGCGNGYITARLAKLGHQVTGLDVARDGISIAQSQYPDLTFRQCSIYADEWPDISDESFDCVVSLEVVEHLIYPKKLFEKSYRLLRTGGHLVVSTPYHGYLKNLVLSLANGWDKHFGVDWEGGHIKFFSKETLRRMAAEAGFKHVNIEGVGRLPWLWKSMIMVAQK